MGSSGQNWRVEIDAYDYMLHERKQTTVDNRRPGTCWPSSTDTSPVWLGRQEPRTPTRTSWV
jgi:hypothetical protein